MKFKQLLEFPTGSLLLALAILIDRFLPAGHFFDFMAGLLVGLSLVLNLKYAFLHFRKNVFS